MGDLLIGDVASALVNNKHTHYAQMGKPDQIHWDTKNKKTRKRKGNSSTHAVKVAAAGEEKRLPGTPRCSAWFLILRGQFLLDA